MGEASALSLSLHECPLSACHALLHAEPLSSHEWIHMRYHRVALPCSDTLRTHTHTHVQETALLCLRNDNPFRERAMAMASWRLFNNGVLGLILLNSIVLGMTDYDVLDCNCGSDKFGDPVVTGCQPWDPPLCETGYRPERVYSWRNHLGEATEPVFTVLFTIECAIRIVAMGFVGPRKMCSKLTAPSPPPLNSARCMQAFAHDASRPQRVYSLASLCSLPIYHVLLRCWIALLTENSYLRDPWNVLDFVVVVAG